MTYQVKLEVFEGPLDLLLHLIKKEEIDIYNIPVSRITEEYLQYLEMLKMLNLEIAGEFLVMAATLLQIKSRKLLPVAVKEDEAPEELDPYQELVRQLLDYKRFKEVAKALEIKEIEQQKVFTRPAQKMERIGDEEYIIEASLFDLLDAFKNVLKASNTMVREIIQEEVRIEERVRIIREKLTEKESLTFEEIFTPESTRMEMVVTFLAMLELIKMKEIRILQTRLFDKIRIFKNRTAADELAAQATVQEELHLVQ
ncbi:MAG: segregation/condensation protein A [Elusimicrobia bacterium]|nr:segregation/condensation protein A [Elusimicrobiota bacterium]